MLLVNSCNTRNAEKQSGLHLEQVKAAYKLPLPELEDDNGVKLNAANSFWRAIRTIVIADLIDGPR